jgi:hypothetical protein
MDIGFQAAPSGSLTCAQMLAMACSGLSAPTSASAKVTAGLSWPPLMCDVAYAITAASRTQLAQ